ncbi:hypothetical protein VKT23_009404 [Stygiomarasmius scandens]|uniref:Uncharacterized protein n=1 Tax=Marasmiellus scandens TaxID=2682957 RepID=A0ABR1JFC5_9AGAR
MPPDGRSAYEAGDFKILCRSTPITLWDIPPYLLDHPAIPGFHAPWLWCGWFGTNELCNLVETRYPDQVVRNSRGRKGPYETVFKLSHIIIKEFQIPEEHHRFVKVVDVALPNGKVDLGLVVGNNFEGLLPLNTDYLARITRDLFDKKDPQWILDAYRWKWIPQHLGRRPELPEPGDPEVYDEPPEVSPSFARLI